MPYKGRFLDIQNAPSPELCIQTLGLRVPLGLRPVTHSHKNIPFPNPPPVSERGNNSSLAKSIDFSQTSKSSAGIASVLSDEEPQSSQAANVPQLLNQNDLNDLVRDLGSSRKNWSSYL